MPPLPKFCLYLGNLSLVHIRI